MAAAIKALNARIRANPVTDYLFSTHFLGPASNFGIPIAAVMDTQKDPDIVSGPMTAALLGYSSVFMRYSMAVTPKNYLLFGCHIVNFTAQMTQGYRYVNHHYMGGKEKALQARAQEGLGAAGAQAESAGADAMAKMKQGASVVEEKAQEAGQKAKELVK
ncbi:hypothetical protein MBLNU230_g6044t1 [Neophaeotheca triangularis]